MGELAPKRPIPIARAVTVEWIAVEGPYLCDGEGGCGHEHYGRRPSGQVFWATQWHICEDPECRCQALVTRWST